MTKNILILIAFTLGAWLIHFVLVWTYMPHFSSTKAISFRIVHMVEIGIVVGAMLTLYNYSLSKVGILVTILGTLVVIDAILFAASKSLRQDFDIFHFLAVYAVIAAIVFILK